nr:uncharacterized protein LOC112991964 isoform X2 [Dromaius novaehollandiae]
MDPFSSDFQAYWKKECALLNEMCGQPLLSLYIGNSRGFLRARRCANARQAPRVPRSSASCPFGQPGTRSALHSQPSPRCKTGANGFCLARRRGGRYEAALLLYRYRNLAFGIDFRYYFIKRTHDSLQRCTSVSMNRKAGKDTKAAGLWKSDSGKHYSTKPLDLPGETTERNTVSPRKHLSPASEPRLDSRGGPRRTVLSRGSLAAACAVQGLPS